VLTIEISIALPSRTDILFQGWIIYFKFYQLQHNRLLTKLDLKSGFQILVKDADMSKTTFKPSNDCTTGLGGHSVYAMHLLHL
jgi:hypothetical protein